MKSFLLILLSFSIFGGSGYCEAEGIAVVVNRANPVDKLSIAQLARIYKGQQQQWPDGKQIIVVNRPVDSAVRKVFYQKVLASKPTQKFYLPNTPIPFRTIVQRSSLATVKFVSNLPEAIGYLYLNELELDEKSKNVKIIRVIEIEDDPSPPSEEK
jgi:phosphate transport system substrate-binding protein